MTPTEHDYIKRYSKRGSFEMATSRAGYVTAACYLVGAIAVHRQGREWKLSHATTGMGLMLFAPILLQAVRMARSIDSCVPWSTVKRTAEIGAVRGMTKKKREALAAMAATFHGAKRSARKVSA